MGFPLSTFRPVSVFIFTMEINRVPIFIEDIIDTINGPTLIIENITVATIGSATTGSMTGILTGRTMVIRINTSGVSGPLKLAIINEPEKVSKMISIEGSSQEFLVGEMEGVTLLFP